MPPISARVWCPRFFAARFWQLKMPKFGVAFEDDFERPSFQPTLAEFKNSTTWSAITRTGRLQIFRSRPNLFHHH